MSALDSPRILVVDSKPLPGNPIEVALERIGCATIAPLDPTDEALALIDADVFDAAILDVQAAEVDCFAVADACLEAGLPVAFISGALRRDLPVLFAACPVLRMPITDQDLRNQIHALVRHDSAASIG